MLWDVDGWLKCDSAVLKFSHLFFGEDVSIAEAEFLWNFLEICNRVSPQNRRPLTPLLQPFVSGSRDEDDSGNFTPSRTTTVRFQRREEAAEKGEEHIALCMLFLSQHVVPKAPPSISMYWVLLASLRGRRSSVTSAIIERWRDLPQHAVLRRRLLRCLDATHIRLPISHRQRMGMMHFLALRGAISGTLEEAATSPVTPSRWIQASKMTCPPTPPPRLDTSTKQVPATTHAASSAAAEDTAESAVLARIEAGLWTASDGRLRSRPLDRESRRLCRFLSSLMPMNDALSDANRGTLRALLSGAMADPPDSTRQIPRLYSLLCRVIAVELAAPTRAVGGTRSRAAGGSSSESLTANHPGHRERERARDERGTPSPDVRTPRTRGGSEGEGNYGDNIGDCGGHTLQGRPSLVSQALDEKDVESASSREGSVWRRDRVTDRDNELLEMILNFLSLIVRMSLPAPSIAIIPEQDSTTTARAQSQPPSPASHRLQRQTDSLRKGEEATDPSSKPFLKAQFKRANRRRSGVGRLRIFRPKRRPPRKGIPCPSSRCTHSANLWRRSEADPHASEHRPSQQVALLLRTFADLTEQLLLSFSGSRAPLRLTLFIANCRDYYPDEGGRPLDISLPPSSSWTLPPSSPSSPSSLSSSQFSERSTPCLHTLSPSFSWSRSAVGLSPRHQNSPTAALFLQKDVLRRRKLARETLTCDREPSADVTSLPTVSCPVLSNVCHQPLYQASDLLSTCLIADRGKSPQLNSSRLLAPTHDASLQTKVVETRYAQSEKCTSGSSPPLLGENFVEQFFELWHSKESTLGERAEVDGWLARRLLRILFEISTGAITKGETLTGETATGLSNDSHALIRICAHFSNDARSSPHALDLRRSRQSLGSACSEIASANREYRRHSYFEERSSAKSDEHTVRETFSYSSSALISSALTKLVIECTSQIMHREALQAAICLDSTNYIRRSGESSRTTLLACLTTIFANLADLWQLIAFIFKTKDKTACVNGADEDFEAHGEQPAIEEQRASASLCAAHKGRRKTFDAQRRTSTFRSSSGASSDSIRRDRYIIFDDDLLDLIEDAICPLLATAQILASAHTRTHGDGGDLGLEEAIRSFTLLSDRMVQFLDVDILADLISEDIERTCALGLGVELLQTLSRQLKGRLPPSLPLIGSGRGNVEPSGEFDWIVENGESSDNGADAIETASYENRSLDPKVASFIHGLFLHL